MSTYGFSENDAKRIGRAVRHVERGAQRVRLGGPDAEGAAPGVRLLIGKLAASSWPTSTTALITIYNGDVGSVATAATVVAYNHFLKLSDQTNCTNRWVALGHNGFQWHPVEVTEACTTTCTIEVGGVDFSEFPGYQQTATQFLGHDGNACLKWFDITTCP